MDMRYFKVLIGVFLVLVMTGCPLQEKSYDEKEAEKYVNRFSSGEEMPPRVEMEVKELYAKFCDEYSRGLQEAVETSSSREEADAKIKALDAKYKNGIELQKLLREKYDIAAEVEGKCDFEQKCEKAFQLYETLESNPSYSKIYTEIK